MQVSDAMRDRATAVLEAVDALDVERLSAVLHDDVTFRFASADPVHGRAAVEEASRAYNASIAAVHHEVVDLWEPEPDVAVVVVDVDYRRLDGRELRLPCCNIFRFRDGLVVDFRIYMDINPVFAPA